MTATTARRVSSTVAARRLSKSVDKLARLQALIARATFEADIIKDNLKACGMDVVEGTHHKAVIVTREVARLDTQAARKLLSAEQVTACTRLAICQSISLYDL
jgi:hypothetical protein